MYNFIIELMLNKLYNLLKILIIFKLPVMNPFPGPNSILVMDNASIRKSFKVQEILTTYGVIVIYLPLYLPDFNPVMYYFLYKLKLSIIKILIINYNYLNRIMFFLY